MRISETINDVKITYVTGLNAAEEQFGQTRLLDSDQMRLEQTLGRLETLASNPNHTTVRQLKEGKY